MQRDLSEDIVDGNDEVVRTVALQGADADTQFFQSYEFAEDEDGMANRAALVDSVINRALNDKMTIKVNVGLGATNPQRKIQAIMGAVQAVAQLPTAGQNIDGDEVAKEIFTANGFQDGSRFLKRDQDEQQEITEEDLQAAYQQGAQEGELAIKQQKIDADLQIASAKLELDRELGYAQIALKENITIAQLQAKLEIDIKKDQTHRDIEALRERSKQAELQFKRETGKPGI